MKEKFILLNTVENVPVLVGVSNIALIEPIDEQKAKCMLTLNFARSKDLWPKTIKVKESFDEVQVMIGIRCV
jgi:hypothetical protein